MPEIDEMDSETVVNSSEAIDPDETISEDEAGEPRLARNGYNDTGKFFCIFFVSSTN